MQQNNDVFVFFVDYLARLHVIIDDLCYEKRINIAFICFYGLKNAMSIESIHATYTQHALRC